MTDDPRREILIERIRSELMQEIDKAFLGPKRFIYAYRDTLEQCPAQQFWDSLPSAAAASYLALFHAYCDGCQLRGEKHKPLGNDLYEFKHIQSKSRIIHVTDLEGTCVLLFGFSGKKENKIDREHILRAEHMRDEYLNRRKLIEDKVRLLPATPTSGWRR